VTPEVGRPARAHAREIFSRIELILSEIIQNQEFNITHCNLKINEDGGVP
jgi:hypothetical protein